MGRTQKLEWIAWSTVGAMAIIAMVSFPFSRVAFVPNRAFYGNVAMAIIIPLLAWMAAALSTKLKSGTKVATIAKAIALRLRLFAKLYSFQIVLLAGLIACSYLAAATSLPLWDDTFSAADKALGFDWLASLKLANETPFVAGTLTFAYASSQVQAFALYLLLCLLAREERIAETMAIIALCSLLTTAIALPFPAAGATAYYRPAVALLTHFSPLAGAYHVETFMALRGAAPELDFDKVIGVIQFPSYHTVVALLVPYAVRDISLWLLVPVIALNALVIVSTLPEGGHHLVDVIGGAMVFAAVALAVRAVR